MGIKDKIMISIKPNKNRILWATALLILLWFALCLPKPLFQDPWSTLLMDREKKLLSAKIADDGQWRFPIGDSLPDKFVKAITYFEDEYFFQHPGVNPVSLFRALKQNLSAGEIVSGGSTISMQTIRLARKGRRRTLLQKSIEIVLAVRMEITYSKNEILNLYSAHAPFGGNVVGLEAAAWRYYGRRPDQLSWSEVCTLAVLPNAPSLIYPGKNHEILKRKRNRLLDKLFENGELDELSCELAKMEPLPDRPQANPYAAPHLLERLIKEGHKGERIVSTIQKPLQEDVNRIVDEYYKVFSQNEIYNIAVLVIDVENASVLAYVGNSNYSDTECGQDVDVISSPRSTGSILKPFLYASMLQDGVILPKTLVADIPTQISGFAPKNFDKSFDGMVHADEALARSLNIPAVRMLQEYGLERFHNQLQKINLHSIDQPANHYGLSLILGGAEATLWDLCNAYSAMAQTLNDDDVMSSSSYLLSDRDRVGIGQKGKAAFDPGAIWWTFEAMTSLNRPWQETGWQDFQSARKIAWKTGTSFGHRDAWAIGVTPKYVVGVWVGNADGEGRPGLTGLSTAAPVMFSVFKHLPPEKWFYQPEWDLVPVKVCRKSGYIASAICDETEELLLPLNAYLTAICPYHQIVHLDKEKKYRVSSRCYSVSEMKEEAWFVLPPVQEWYFKQKNPFYKTLPPFKEGCQPEVSTSMAVIYPKDFTRIFIPRELDGTKGKAVFEIAHRNSETSIFWHLDQEYLGTTKINHRMELNPKPGKHQMTLVDEQGESISWRFEVLER